MAKVDLYGGRDPRDVPTYGLREAASYMRLPPTTLREWVTGLAGVIRLAGNRPPLLSFWNLVEAFLERVERDPKGLADRLFPWTREPGEPREVEIDPRRAFGKLVVAGPAFPRRS